VARYARFSCAPPLGARPRSIGAIDAEAPRPARQQQYEAADDRSVLPEIDILRRARRRVGEFPIAMRDQRRDDGEADHQTGGPARLEAEQDDEPTKKLDRRRDRGDGGPHGHAARGENAAEALEIEELAVAARYEKNGEQQAT